MIRQPNRTGKAGNGTFKTCVFRNIWQGKLPLAGIVDGGRNIARAPFTNTINQEKALLVCKNELAR